LMKRASTNSFILPWMSVRLKPERINRTPQLIS
jgi:hypothetical protein